VGDVPILGRLFGTQTDEKNKKEIIISITPRIVRNTKLIDSDLLEMWSGTENSMRFGTRQTGGAAKPAVSAAPARAPQAAAATPSLAPAAPAAPAVPAPAPAAMGTVPIVPLQSPMLTTPSATTEPAPEPEVEPAQ